MTKRNKIRKPAPPRTARAEVDTMLPTRERQKVSAFDEARTFEFEPDERGRLVRRPMRVLRDRNASAATRLMGLGLTGHQMMAAVMFERDHEASMMEPKMTANLDAAGGRSTRAVRPEYAESVDQARSRKHFALQALRLAGPEVVRVVEDAVLVGSTLTAAGAVLHRHRGTAKATALLALQVGLSLLENHYRINGRIAE